jgi:putative transposase
MPRRARITAANIAHHIIQRGNNRSACFYAEDDYLLYLEWLHKYALERECQIHAYVLMTNHVHLLVTPADRAGLAGLMKSLGQRYVQYINRSYSRSGTLWEGRFKSCIANESNYVLGCYRYIELNPVRACMVSHPGDYRWSSYGANAQSDNSTLLTPHESYRALGRRSEDRLRAYRSLFKSEISSELIDEIRTATNGNYALGSEKFTRDVEEMLGRRARLGKRGRPSKSSLDCD